MTFGAGEQTLSNWMSENAFVCWLEPYTVEIESRLIRELRPPLNLAQLTSFVLSASLADQKRGESPRSVIGRVTERIHSLVLDGPAVAASQHREVRMAKRKAAAKRELINTGKDKRYVRRDVMRGCSIYAHGHYRASDCYGTIDRQFRWPCAVLVRSHAAEAPEMARRFSYPPRARGIGMESIWAVHLWHKRHPAQEKGH